jgi:hypothetical protein
MPQILLSLNVRLSPTFIDRVDNERSLSYLTDTTSLYKVRYDTRHITSRIETLLYTFEIYQLEKEKASTTAMIVTNRRASSRSFGDIFVYHPDTYVYLSTLLDYSLATGKQASNGDLVPLLQELVFSGSSTFNSAPKNCHGMSLREDFSLSDLINQFEANPSYFSVSQSLFPRSEEGEDHAEIGFVRTWSEDGLPRELEEIHSLDDIVDTIPLFGE